VFVSHPSPSSLISSTHTAPHRTPTQGFPRADIDVASVRADRVAIIRAANDHKALTSQMEALLHALHEEAR
jgi:hypothetical protein